MRVHRLRADAYGLAYRSTGVGLELRCPVMTLQRDFTPSGSVANEWDDAEVSDPESEEEDLFGRRR